MIYNNKLIAISKYLKNIYINDLDRYIYISPNDRTKLKKGNIIKYININDLDYKLKSGIIINISIDKITFKSISSNIYWKIKINNNHIFCLERNDFKLLLNNQINN
jgi:hypothetical protein